MVESSKKSKIDFRKISQKDIRQFFQLAVIESQRIIFWKSLNRFYEGKILKIDQGAKVEILLKALPVNVNLLNESVNVNFQFKDLELFGRGKVLKQNDDLLELLIEVEEEFYKVEERSFERVELYPSIEAYVYFVHHLAHPKNVISFKPDQDQFILDQISKNQRQKLESIIDSSLGENDEILGFRVDEITANGISFFCNASEFEVVFKDRNEKWKGSFSLEGKIYELNQCQFIYSIEYISSNFKDTNMLKLGFSFTKNDQLKIDLEKKFNKNLEVLDYKKEFEEYLKNEN